MRKLSKTYHPSLVAMSFLLVTQSSCIEPELEANEWINWVEDESNGYKQIKNIGEFEIEVQNQPVLYKALKELGPNAPKNKIEDTSKDFEGTLYYSLTIKKKNGDTILGQPGSLKYQETLYYFSFRMQDDIYLEINNQKISCSLYHYERGYQLREGATISLGFEAPQDFAKENTIVLDSEYFNTGPIRLKFYHTILPELKYLNESK